MKLTATIAPCLALLWVAGALTAQPEQGNDDTQTPRRLLAQQAPVEGSPDFAGQLVRLPLPLEVLRATQTNLSDLRVFNGEEQLGYFVRRAPRAERSILETVEPAMGPQIDRRVSGSEARRPMDVAESYTLTPPPQSPAASAEQDQGDAAAVWQMRFLVPPSRQEFVAQLRLSWVSSDSDRALGFYQGSLFRLQDGRERLTVQLPAAPTDDISWLKVEIERQASTSGIPTPLQPRFVFERFENISAQAPQLEIDTEAELQTHLGSAVYRVDLGGGLVPDAFRFETSRGNFDRTLRIFAVPHDTSSHASDLAPQGTSTHPNRSLIAAERIYRFRSADRTSEPKLVIDVPNSNTTTFEIEIDGGDSPPLEDLRITALVRQPEVVFEWPAQRSQTTNPPQVDLLFGGGRVALPKFDLWSRSSRLLSSASARQIPLADRMEVLTQLDGAGLVAVSLGDITANPNFDQTPLLAFLQRAGAPIDTGLFAFQAPLELEANDTGLHIVPLGPEVQAQLRADRGDLRFVDAAGQWPYLLQAGRTQWRRDLAIATAGTGADSVLTLTLGEDLDWLDTTATLQANTITLTVDAPFFDRSYSLAALDGKGAAIATTTGRLAPATAQDAFYAPDRSQHAVTLAVPPQRANHYELTINNGDDAPLPLNSAILSGPMLQALLAAPAGEYSVLYGAPSSSAVGVPKYEIERARSVVLSLRGTEATPGPATAIGGWRWSTLPLQQALLWAAILIAVLGLGWVTLRSIQ